MSGSLDPSTLSMMPRDRLHPGCDEGRHCLPSVLRGVDVGQFDDDDNNDNNNNNNDDIKSGEPLNIGTKHSTVFSE